MIIYNKLENYFVVSADRQIFSGFEMTENLRDISPLIEGLVMKPCHDNNGAAIYVGRAATVRNLSVSCSHGS